MPDEQEPSADTVAKKPKRKYAKRKKAAKRVSAHPGVIETIAPRYAAPRQVTGRRYTVDLQTRHADWLEAVARMEGRSPENMLERLVRLGYAADPYKGKGPQAGETAGGGFSGKKDDLPGG